MAQFQSSGVTGSLDVTTNITASGHISASIFYGDGSGLSGVSAGGISSLVEDTAPQLGGTLDVNGQAISGSTVSLISDTVELTGSNFIFGRTTNVHGLVYNSSTLTMRHHASSITVGNGNWVALGDASLYAGDGVWVNDAGSPWNLIDGKRWSFRANDTTGYYLYLGTSGSPKVVVTGSSLGIGTDTPSASLDVVGTFRTSGSSIQMTGSLNVSAPDDTSGALLIQEGSNEYIRINTSNSSEETHIKAGGTQGLIIYGNSRTAIATGTSNSASDFRITNSGGTQLFQIKGNHDTELRANNFSIRDAATNTPYLTTDTNTNFTYKLSSGAVFKVTNSSDGDLFSISETGSINLSGSSIQMTGSVNLTGSGNEQFVIFNSDAAGASKKILRTKMYNNQPILQLYNGGNIGLIAYGYQNTPVIGAYSGGSLTIRGISNESTAAGTDMAKFDFNNSIFQVTGSLSITGSSGGTIQSSLDSNGTGSLRLFTDGTQINPFISLTAWSGSFPFKFAYISTGTETGASEPSASLSLSHYPPLAGGVATLTSSLHTDIKGKHVRLNTDQTDSTYTVTSDDLYVDGNFKASGGSHVEMRTTTEVFSASATQIDIGITDAAGTTDVYIGRSQNVNPVIKIDASNDQTEINYPQGWWRANSNSIISYVGGTGHLIGEYLQGPSTYWRVYDGTNDYIRVNKSAATGAGNCDSIIMSGSLVAITSSQTKLVDDDGSIYFRTNNDEVGLGNIKYTQVGGGVSIVGIIASNYIRTYGSTLLVDGATLDNSLNASSEYFRSVANDTTIYLGYNGPFRVTGSMVITGSGSTLLKVEGSQGDLFSVTDSLSGSLFSVNDISGLPVLEAFSDNTIVMGDFAAPSLTTTARATINSPGGYVFSIPTGTYDGYYIDYTVVSSSLGDMRAGQIITIRSGSSYHYTEQTTTDFGSTTAVTFNVEASGSNVSLYATASSGTYTVKAIVRAI